MDVYDVCVLGSTCPPAPHCFAVCLTVLPFAVGSRVTAARASQPVRCTLSSCTIFCSALSPSQIFKQGHTEKCDTVSNSRVGTGWAFGGWADWAASRRRRASSARQLQARQLLAAFGNLCDACNAAAVRSRCATPSRCPQKPLSVF